MVYTFKNHDISLEFSGNRGNATVQAVSEVDALRRLHEVFGHMRDEAVHHRFGREYFITFKVAFNYRLPLLRSVERIVKRVRTRQAFDRARYLDRYLVACLAQMNGKPDWLFHDSLSEEITALRKAAVIAREVAGILQFVDWDIVLANYLELNSKAGHKSRSIRKKIPREQHATQSAAMQGKDQSRRTRKPTKKNLQAARR